jgi:hypothetical protein
MSRTRRKEYNGSKAIEEAVEAVLLVCTTRWIDIATQLVVRRRQPESKVRVKELLRHKFEPLSSDSSNVDPWLAQEFHPPRLTQVIHP